MLLLALVILLLLSSVGFRPRSASDTPVFVLRWVLSSFRPFCPPFPRLVGRGLLSSVGFCQEHISVSGGVFLAACVKGSHPQKLNLSRACTRHKAGKPTLPAYVISLLALLIGYLGIWVFG